MRRVVKGKEVLILREDDYGGFESIDVEKLTMKMDEIFSETFLAEMADEVPMSLQGLKAMTFMAFIKADIIGGDVLGWGQHQKALKEEGFDV